jgi:NDP-sugar pyrophosphorylase family protein
MKYGITNFYISVRYLSEQIISYFGDGSSRNINITYIEEEEPLGTIGALSLIKDIPHEHLLVMNSDILTNIDVEDFFQYYIRHDVLMCIASIPYNVKIPYGVLEIRENHQILSLKEKPTYTYYSNAGIYMLNLKAQQYIPEKTLYNATDLMDCLINDDKQVIHYPILNYWLDIGKHEDYLKAQEDFKQLKYNM